MIIEKIQLTNWKIFREPVEIQLKDGLNILYGPNESGKSTVIDSVRTTFFSKHTSNSPKIKSITPLGTSLKPQSTISFSKGGQNYRITKEFNRGTCVLEHLNNEMWQKIAEGDQADKELIQLVGGQLPPKGDTKSKFWGLGQTLWMVQGTPFIEEELNDETHSALQNMIGATIESEQEKKVLSEIKTKFLNTFTEKKKELKNKSELGIIKDEIEKRKNELNNSQQNIKKKEILMRTLEDNNILFEKNKSNLQITSKEKTELEIQVNEAHEHVRNREKLESEINELNTKFIRLKERIDEINSCNGEIVNILSSNEQIKIQLDPLKADSDKLNQEMEDTISAVRTLDENINNHLEESTIVGIAHTAVMDEQSLDEKKIQLKEISDLKVDIDSTKEKFDSILVPSGKEFIKIEELSQQIRDTETSLKAIGLNITAITDDKISGEIFLDREKTSFDLKEESFSWNAHQSVKIILDQVGEIEVKSGSQDVQGMKETLEKLKIQYHELIDPYPTNDLSEFKSLINQKKSFENDLEWLKDQMNKKSRNGKKEIENDIQTLKNKIRSNWDKIPDESLYKECEGKDRLEVREELSLKINQIDDDISHLQKERQQLNDILENNRIIVKKTDKIIIELQTKLHGNNQRKEEIERRITRLTINGEAIEETESELNQLSVKLEQKERALIVYQKEIEDKEIKPLRSFEGLKNKVERLDEELRKQEIKKAESERELSIIMAQSTDSSVIEEHLSPLKIKEVYLETEAEAIKLLFNITSFYQDNTICKLSEPLEQRVTADLENVLGPKYSLKFDNKMKPESIQVDGQEAPLNILSFGTQEQVWYLFRLALGNILSSDERQLVVLDDPLVNTDSVRMHHALQILEENAKNMQIIVVTCDVDKYNSLIDANFISLM